MAGVLVNSGEDRMLGLLVNKTTTGYDKDNLVLRLFKSDTTPGETHTSTDYTQADFTGYSAVTLTNADWTLTPGAPSNATALQKTFTVSSATSQSIYGYYLTTAATSGLVAAERFSDGPYVVTNVNDAVKVTSVITQD